MSTLTVTTAAEQLLADVRHMLARHDGAETVDELRELADELSTALRRVRGRITRLAKRDESDAPTPVAPPAPTSNEPAPKVAPSAAPTSNAPTPATDRQGGAGGPDSNRECQRRSHRPLGARGYAPSVRRRWWRPAVIVAAVLLMLAVLVAVARAETYIRAASANNPTAISGCVIRFDERTSSGNTRPRIHANGSHFCLGIQRVYAEYPSGDLVVEQDAVGPVVFIAVSPDETLTSRDIECGPSGGAGVIRIRCYRDGNRVKAYSSAMYGHYSNIWLGVASWDRSAA